jgi:hypothetical protein
MTEEKFWAKVNKEGVEGCWEWLGCISNYGYGQFWYNKKATHAHRYSWILKNGAIPEGLIIRHKCKGKCVNPDHLELGTQQDNMNDMIRDNTVRKGIKHHNCKLTPEQVKEIRTRTNERYIKLAKEYNVSHSAISDIIHRRKWAWLE